MVSVDEIADTLGFLFLAHIFPEGSEYFFLFIFRFTIRHHA